MPSTTTGAPLLSRLTVRTPTPGRATYLKNSVRHMATSPEMMTCSVREAGKRPNLQKHSSVTDLV